MSFVVNELGNCGCISLAIFWKKKISDSLQMLTFFKDTPVNKLLCLITQLMFLALAVVYSVS